ncbi:MAG: M23 family metallopeptidase [Bacteroidota bacterium]
MKRYLKLFFCFIIISGCASKKVPTTRLYQYSYEKVASVDGDSLIVNLSNPLRCPLRVWITTTTQDLQRQFDVINPIILTELSDSTFYFNISEGTQISMDFNSLLGDTTRVIEKQKITLPFPTGRQYKIIQGYDMLPTHNTPFSKYAIDFSLQPKDTICAATDGYVVGVIKDYKYGGWDTEWRNHSNYITIYDPSTGLFTQYAHLIHQGSFVKLGDKVKKGMPIGLSGMTGQTNIEHLHFNCLIPVNTKDGLQSVPIEFEEGYIGKKLKRGDIVKH